MDGEYGHISVHPPFRERRSLRAPEARRDFDKLFGPVTWFLAERSSGICRLESLGIRNCERKNLSFRLEE